ncbi:hypothetical protein D3C81_229780 [compost metagenome]
MLSAIKHGLQHFGKSYIALAPETVRKESYYIALSDGKTTWYLANTEHWMTVYNESMLLTWNQTEHYWLNDQRSMLLQGIALQIGHIARTFDTKAVCLNLVKLDTNVIVNSVWIEEYITKRAQMIPISIAMDLPEDQTRGVYVVGEQQRHVFDHYHVVGVGKPPTKPIALVDTWAIPTVKEFRKRHNMNIVTPQEVMAAVEALFENPAMWEQRQNSNGRYFWTIPFSGVMDQSTIDGAKMFLEQKGWEVLWGFVNGVWDLTLYVNKD